MKWECVIGIEAHVQLATESKLFSGSATQYGSACNTQVSWVDMGLPGTLPVVNREAVHMAVKLGLAIGADVALHSTFARKNYFYPDLPKGYQISQYDEPIVSGGRVDVLLDDGRLLPVAITRAHLEEDAGKLTHDQLPGYSGVDLNRAGIGLLEVVSEPVMHSAAEAVAYARALRALVRTLGICSGNMQEGALRFDVNCSVRLSGSDVLGTRTELKNLNSFRFIEMAVAFEIQRQIERLESGNTILQETRLYDPQRNETRAMRSKEQAEDYRYFPDPDLLPLQLTPSLIEQIRATLPELPQHRAARYRDQWQLSDQDIVLLVNDPALAAYVDTVVGATRATPIQAVNWVLSELLGKLNKMGVGIASSAVAPEQLATLLDRQVEGVLSGKLAKQVFEIMWHEGEPVDQIIELHGLKQIDNTDSLMALIDQVILDNPKQLMQYQAGKTKLLGYFVGQVMKLAQGKADPALLNQLLHKKLDG